MVNLIPEVFPDEPTEYLEIERVTASKEFVAPEEGWFEFIGLAASGKGGSSASRMFGKRYFGGGGGGGAGGVVVSVFALNQGDVVSLGVNGNVTISHGDETATATIGGPGGKGNVGTSPFYATGGSGGSGGSASGGNIANQPGGTGGRGRSVENDNDTPESSLWGVGATNSYAGYSTSGGAGNNSAGSSAYIVVLRGNTNIPLSTQNAQDITALMLQMSRISQEQTSLLLQ